MSKRMQATARFAAVVILAVLLTGCIKLNLDFTVSSDNTVSGTMVFAFSKQLLQLTGQSAQDLLASSAPIPSSVPGVSEKPYDDGEFAGEEYTFDAVPITEFNSTDPSSPLSIVRSGDTFTVSGVMDLSSGAGVSGAAVWDPCRIQVAELCAWRKAGAWNKVILAVGGITTVERAREALAVGADAAMVATAALVDPLLAARFRSHR